MELTIYYPRGFLEFKSFKSVILLHLSEHLIFNYLFEKIKLSETYKHFASTVFDFTYFNFVLDKPNKALYQKIIKNLEIVINQPERLQKYFLKEKLKIKNEFYLREIDSNFKLKTLIFASLIKTNVIDYNLKKSIKILDELKWQETKEFIKDNFSFERFLILKKTNNNVLVIKYPEIPTDFKEIKFKINFNKLNKKHPFLLIFLYSFESLPESIFFGGVLRKALNSLVFNKLSNRLYLYSYLNQYHAHSLQKLFNVFIIPYEQPQKLKKEILRIKKSYFLVNKNEFKKLKNEFIKTINKNCFDIFRPFILKQIFKKEIKNFNLKNFRKEILEYIKNLSYEQFLYFLDKLRFIFNK